MKLKNRKAFSIVEVMMASALSLSLGVIVATTLNTATNSMKKSDYRIKANYQARTISANLNKYIASAEVRSYCVNTVDVNNAPIKCSYMDKDEIYNPIVYFGPTIGTKGYQIEFFTNVCATIKLDCANDGSGIKRVNSAKVTIYVKQDSSNPLLGELGICYVKGSGNLYDSINLPTALNPTAGTLADCNNTDWKYVANNIKFDEGNRNIFSLIDSTGSVIACAKVLGSTVPTPDKACLAKIKSVRVLLDVPWYPNPKNIVSMDSKKTSVDSFINIRSSN
jgi:hypothetical protein